MRAIIHWRLLPEPLFATLSQIPSSILRVSRPPCRVASKTKAQRSPGEVRFSAINQSLWRQCCRAFFCCGRTFLKAPGGEKRGHRTRSVNSFYFPREEFSKGHSAHSHTNLHWSALSAVVYAPGVLPRNPFINQPRGGGGGFILENPHFLIQGRWQQWLQQELSFLTYLFVLFDTVWFSLPKFSLHLM